MPRYAGTGPLQRHLISFATSARAANPSGGWVATRVAAIAYRDRPPTRPEMVSFRRAVTALGHQGAIEVEIVRGARVRTPRQVYRVPRPFVPTEGELW
jgi:hypothetical protein